MNEVDVFTEQCLSFLQDITPQDEKLLPQLYNGKSDFCFIPCYEFISPTQQLNTFHLYSNFDRMVTKLVHSGV